MDKTVQEFVSTLFAIEVNAHIAHLQTSSFAEHKALDGLYKDIVDLRDRFIESYQGEYGIIKGYKSFSISEGTNPISYLEGLVEPFKSFRETLSDCGYLQQIIDDILELIYSTLYKLKFLK
jgi:hypothetical protein